MTSRNACQKQGDFITEYKRLSDNYKNFLCQVSIYAALSKSEILKRVGIKKRVSRFNIRKSKTIAIIQNGNNSEK